MEKMLNESSVVGKTIFSDGKGKLFFGYYKTDDAVEFVDYKTWKKLSFKDVSKGDTNKERVIKAILKNQKQFNKKVDFNMWAKKQRRSFEDTMDWFIQNGWINNINKGGIKESVDALSVNEGISVFDERHFGKKGIIIMIDDNGKKVSAIFKDKKNADKYNRNNPSDIQALLKIAKTKPFGKAIDESVNEAASKEAMGIAALTGTRGSAVQDFINKNRINSKKLFKALKSANLQGRMNFASALSGKPGNPNEKLTIKLFGESVNEGTKYKVGQKTPVGKIVGTSVWGKGSKQEWFYDVQKPGYAPKQYSEKSLDKIMGESVNEEKPGLWANIRAKQKRGEKPAHKNSQAHKDAVKAGKQINNEAKFGYKDSTASYINKHKDEYKQAEKMNNGNEKKFYDMLQQMEEKVGHGKTMLFISNALRGYGVDMFKDPKIKNPQDAQEALFLLSK